MDSSQRSEFCQMNRLDPLADPPALTESDLEALGSGFPLVPQPLQRPVLIT